jgi:hypothetical protein
VSPEVLARRRAQDARYRAGKTAEQRAARKAYMREYSRRRKEAEKVYEQQQQQQAVAALAGILRLSEPPAPGSPPREGRGGDPADSAAPRRHSRAHCEPDAARPNDPAEGVAVGDPGAYQRAHAEACRQARLLHAGSAGSSGPAADAAAAAAARDAYVRAYMQGYARALAGRRASAGETRRRGDDDDGGAGVPARRENPAGRGVEEDQAREADGARRDGSIRQQPRQRDETTPKDLVAPQRENQATQAGDSLQARQAPGRKRGRPRKVDQHGENGRPYEAKPCIYLTEEERLARNERQRLYRAGLTEEQKLAQALTGRARKHLVRAKLAEERERARSGEADASLALGAKLAEEDGLARGKKPRLRESDRYGKLRDNLMEEEGLARNERQRLCGANLTEEQKVAQGLAQKGLIRANQPAEERDACHAESQPSSQANRAEGEVTEPDASTTAGSTPGASPQQSPPHASGNILDSVFTEFVTHCRREREAKRAAQPGPHPDPAVPQNRQPNHVEEQRMLSAAHCSAERPGASQTQRLECALSQVKRRLQLLKQQVQGLGLPPPPPPPPQQQQQQQRPLLLFPPLEDSDGDYDDCVYYDDDEDDDDDDETDATCDVAEDEDILTE